MSIYSKQKQESAISCISFDFLNRRKSPHICIIWWCDEISRNEWKRNKLYAECVKLRRVICLMRLSLSGSFHPPSSLSVMCTCTRARTYFFFFDVIISPLTIGLQLVSVIGTHQWQEPYLAIPHPLRAVEMLHGTVIRV